MVNFWKKLYGTTSQTFRIGLGRAVLDATGLTAERTFTLPDQAGALMVAPPGLIAAFGGTTPPAGWLECAGQTVSRTTYAALFAAIGTTWGVGNGTTTFTLPDFIRRTLIGAGGSGTSVIAQFVGSVGGQETHTLTTTEMPAHTHGVPFSATSGLAGGPNYNLTGAAGATTTSAGGGGAHNNMQPSAVVLWCIKY